MDDALKENQVTKAEEIGGNFVVTKESADIAKSLLDSINDLINKDKDELENVVDAAHKVVNLLELQSNNLHAQKSMLSSVFSSANVGISLSNSATNLMQMEAMNISNDALEKLFNELVNTSQYHNLSIEVISKLINHINEIQKALTILTSKLGLKSAENLVK